MPWRTGVAAIAVASVLVTGTASADEAPPAAPPDAPVAPAAPVAGSESSRVVEVVVRGDDAEVTALRDTLRELLERLGVKPIDTGDAASETVHFARIEVDLASTEGARVAVVDGSDGSVLLRRVITRDGKTPAIVREEIAQAARSAVEAKLRTEGAPQPPAPPPSPSVPAEPPSPPPRVAAVAPQGLALDVSTFARGGPVADHAGPVLRAGIGVALASRRGIAPSLALTAEYAVPFEARVPSVSAEVSLASLRLLPRVELARGSWFALTVGAGGGLDIFTVVPRSSVLPESALGRTSTRADVVLTGAIATHFKLAPGLVLTVALTTDVDLTSRRWVIDEGREAGDVLSPWRVRPALLAGLDFTALGPTLFAPREAP